MGVGCKLFASSEDFAGVHAQIGQCGVPDSERRGDIPASLNCLRYEQELSGTDSHEQPPFTWVFRQPVEGVVNLGSCFVSQSKLKGQLPECDCYEPGRFSLLTRYPSWWLIP